MLWWISLSFALTINDSARSIMEEHGLTKEEMAPVMAAISKAYREMPRDTVLWHWADQKYFGAKYTPDATDHEGYQAYLQRGIPSYQVDNGNGEAGSGIYLATNPVTAGEDEYGEYLLTLGFSKGTAYIDGAVLDLEAFAHLCKKSYRGYVEFEDVVASRGRCHAAWIAALRSLKVKMFAYRWSQGGRNRLLGCQDSRYAFVLTDPRGIHADALVGYRGQTTVASQHQPLDEMSRQMLSHFGREYLIPGTKPGFLGYFGANPYITMKGIQSLTFGCFGDQFTRPEVPQPDWDYPHSAWDPKGCKEGHEEELLPQAGLLERINHALTDY